MSTSLPPGVRDLRSIPMLDPSMDDEHPKEYRVISASRLAIDSSYQRNPVPYRIKALVTSFDWSAIGVILVSSRPDGSYVILDGQHRWLAARQAVGSDVHLPCLVYYNLSVEEEARIFVRTNGFRGPVRAYHLFRARLEAGDPVAREIAQMMDDLSIQLYLNRHSGSTPVGYISAVGALETIYLHAKHSDQMASMVETLVLLRQAWGDEPGAYDHALMLGLYPFVCRYQNQYDRKDLIKALRRDGRQKIMNRAAEIAHAFRKAPRTMIPHSLVATYNYQKHERNKLPDWRDKE